MAAKVGDVKIIGGHKWTVRAWFDKPKYYADRYAKDWQRQGYATRVIIDKSVGKSKGRRYLVCTRRL